MKKNLSLKRIRKVHFIGIIGTPKERGASYGASS